MDIRAPHVVGLDEHHRDQLDDRGVAALTLDPGDIDGFVADGDAARQAFHRRHGILGRAVKFHQGII
jgi:hypothetical protein